MAAPAQAACTLVAGGSRRPSDAGSVVSETASMNSSQCWSVSTAATLTLSKDEEMEARQLEAKLRKVNSLQVRQSEGKPLTKWEESEIRRKPEIDFAPVMIKVRNGAARWTIDKVPLSPHEEKQVRSAEERLRALKRLQERKALGEWLSDWEMSELRRKAAMESKIESWPLMMRVREGAPRCALDGERPSAPVAAPAAPVAAPAAPAPALVPVPKASPAQAPARAPVPKASPASPVAPTQPQEPTLKDMVATIREELELEDSLTMAQAIAEANRQLGVPATGTLAQQARSLFRQVTSA